MFKTKNRHPSIRTWLYLYEPLSVPSLKLFNARVKTEIKKNQVHVTFSAMPLFSKAHIVNRVNLAIE